MSFSSPGQILVSRSFYEVVSRMSDEYAQLFQFEGARTDKHVREHEVYAVQPTAAPLRRPARDKAETSSGSSPLIIDKLAHSASYVAGNLRRKPRLGTAVAVVSILAVSVGLRVHRQPAELVAAQIAPAKTAAAQQPAPVETAIKAPPASEKKPAAAAKKTEAPRPAAAGEPVVVRFAISPWGEVYINDTKRGVAPPMHELALKPGRYKVEIKNVDFPSHVEVIEVKPGSRIRIRHKFQ
jgi:hypothetical protein